MRLASTTNSVTNTNNSETIISPIKHEDGDGNDGNNGNDDEYNKGYGGVTPR